MRLLPLLFLLLSSLVASPMTLEECIQVALSNHPEIALSENTAKIYESRVGQAKSDYYPKLDYSAGYTHYDEATGNFKRASSSLTLRQTLYDFGRSSFVKQSSKEHDAALADLGYTKRKIIYDVKEAYYSFLEAKEALKVAQESVLRFQKHLEQAEGFYKTGTRPRIDVAKARADLASAKVALIRANNTLGLAKAALANAMGISQPPDLDVLEVSIEPTEPIVLEEALRRAYREREDLVSLEAKIESARAGVQYAKSGYYPTLSADAAYLQTDGSFWPRDESSSVGVSLSLSLFSGFLTKYRVEESRWALLAARARKDSLTQKIVLEVKQAYLGVKEAVELIKATKVALDYAQENYDLAEGRYSAGVANSIELTDAATSLSEAKLKYIKSLYQYKIASAALEKAIGAAE